MSTQLGRPVPKRAEELSRRSPEGRRWTLLRLRAGLTQAAAAHLADVHPVTLGAIERGVQGAGVALATRLEAIYAEVVS